MSYLKLRHQSRKKFQKLKNDGNRTRNRRLIDNSSGRRAARVDTRISKKIKTLLTL